MTQPMREDETADWLKQWRDVYPPGCPEWLTLNNALDDYRLHADVGAPLSADVADWPGARADAGAKMSGMDAGWQHNDKQCQWELRGEDGCLYGFVTDELIAGVSPQRLLAEHVLERVGSVPPPLGDVLAQPDPSPTPRLEGDMIVKRWNQKGPAR